MCIEEDVSHQRTGFNGDIHIGLVAVKHAMVQEHWRCLVIFVLFIPRNVYRFVLGRRIVSTNTVLPVTILNNILPQQFKLGPATGEYCEGHTVLVRPHMTVLHQYV